MVRRIRPRRPGVDCLEGLLSGGIIKRAVPESMANIVFDFLTESFLFNQEYIETFYSSITNSELRSELRKYREHIQKNIKEIVAEIQHGKDLMNISIESFGHLPDETLLKQIALYLDRVVIPDPVFEHTGEKGNIHMRLSQIMGIKSSVDIDRQELAVDIKYMKDKTSLVANQFVKFFPVSLLHEPPKNLPIFYSENNYSDALPPEVFKFFYEKAKVSNVDRVDGYMCYKDDEPLRLGTTIHVGFDSEHNGMIYQFMNSDVTDFDERTGKCTFRQYIPDTINEQIFRAWVSQSINRAALRTFSETFNELVLSKQADCMYLAKSQFTADLLGLTITKKDIYTDLTNLSMQINLPLFDALSLDDIISVRCNDGEAFHNFRTELNSKLLDLRTITDADELRIKLDNVSYELNEVQINDVKKEYNKILRALGIDVVMLTGSLLTSFFTGGLTLIGAAGATVKGASDYAKYLSEVKENNGYFLWKLNKA